MRTNRSEWSTSVLYLGYGKAVNEDCSPAKLVLGAATQKSQLQCHIGQAINLKNRPVAVPCATNQPFAHQPILRQLLIDYSEQKHISA